MAEQGGESVSMLVDGPLELAGVRVARPHVLGLEVLHLTENVESVPHVVWLMSETIDLSELGENTTHGDWNYKVL